MLDNSILDINDLGVNTIRSPTLFMQEIELLVDEKGMDYIDAVVHYCEVNGIEIETAASLIKCSPKMKAKVQIEAENLNYLPKSGKLPL
jgi:hypothetical protein